MILAKSQATWDSSLATVWLKWNPPVINFKRMRVMFLKQLSEVVIFKAKVGAIWDVFQVC